MGHRYLRGRAGEWRWSLGKISDCHGGFSAKADLENVL